MTSPHIVCCAASPPLQRCASFLLLFYFVRVPSPSNNFQLKVCNLFKGKVAFGFFCQKTEEVFSFSFITSTHPVCFAATPPFQSGEYPPRLLRSHPSLSGRGIPTPSASQPPLPCRVGSTHVFKRFLKLLYYF